MMAPARFPYTVVPGIGPRPLLPLDLATSKASLSFNGLVDSGASVNVLPLSGGLRLGLAWDKYPAIAPLSGILENVPARGLVLTATVAPFSPVRLAFAWAQTDDVPLLLGQVNFFQEFDVCFFRAQDAFEIKPS
jgi:hypothetical protein